jgi:2-oxoglutarate/2-oxoacid ferredoxin oxidoreductase subunit alpha
MRINILITGKAGQGIKGLSDMLSKALVNKGLFVFNYRMYGSLIEGGNNFDILCVSDKPVYSFDEEFDIAVLLDKESLKIHEKEMKNSCVKIHGFNIEGIKIDNLEFKKAKNMVFGGAILKILGLEKKPLEEVVKKKVSGDLLKEDLKAIKKGYESCEINKNLQFKNINKRKNISFIDGSEAVGIGAIESGLDIYYTYPMTPATALLTFLAKHQKKNNYLTFEPESEIAVANAALGASFGGARVMLGSSGGGFDLMTEAVSMQGMTELPLVAYLAMRAGPSSGAATFTSQEDLRMALNCGHGDFFKIVVSPGDIEECYKVTKQAFYLAEKYGILNIILSDKHLAESGFTQEIKDYDLFLEKLGKYPQKNKIKINSYTHDEQGNYTEDSKIIKKIAEKRKKNFQETRKEIENNFEMYKIYGNKDSKKIIVGFGSTKGAILDAINSGELKDYKFIHLIYLSPFPEKLKKELQNKEIFVIENNLTGQLADLIQEKTQVEIPDKNRILKYNINPFTPKEIIGRIKK